MTVNEIADKVVDCLLTLPEGTEISTGQVLGRIFGIDRLEDAVLSDGTVIGFDALLAINRKAREKAKRKGLILDDSKYDDMDIGLLYSIPYVIFHVK